MKGEVDAIWIWIWFLGHIIVLCRQHFVQYVMQNAKLVDSKLEQVGPWHVLEFAWKGEENQLINL